MTRRDSFCRRRGLTQGAKNFKNTVLPAVNSIKLSGVKLGTSEAPATAKTESKEAAANFMVKKYIVPIGFWIWAQTAFLGQEQKVAKTNWGRK